MAVYNVFRSKRNAGICCAVPDDLALPPFLVDTSWTFDRTIESSGSTPVGFNPRAASAGVHFNGFYLFEPFGEQITSRSN